MQDEMTEPECLVFDTALQPRPGGGERISNLRSRCRNRRIDDERGCRRVVDEQHDVSEQAVSAPDVDDAPTAKVPARPSRDFPRLIEFFSRQAFSGTQRAADSIEK